MIDFNLIPLLPEIFLALVAMGLLIVGVGRGNEATNTVAWFSVFALAIAMIVMLGLNWDEHVVLSGMFKFDRFIGFTKLLILVGSIGALSLSVRFIKQMDMGRFEYPILVLMATIGMLLMVSANNMLALYMGLELQSLSLYVLAAFRRNSIKSAEAGIKYFVLGALSSGMLLFGISLIYGFTGSIDFTLIADTLGNLDFMPFGVIFGLVFVLAGMAFKISAAPFHMWTPDVYQGAPTSVTALFAMVPKVAAIALLIRLLYEPFGSLEEQWQQIIYFVSLLSMVVGAFAAIAQDNIKRLMAYSSIGHMGYALIGVVVASEAGISAVMLYMLIYLLMTAGVFAILMSMQRNQVSLEKISDLSGLSQNSPVLAYSMAVLMLSMAGIPPMAGFFGKLFIFQAAVEAKFYILAVLGVLASVVSAYYYLRIIKVMFFDAAVDPYDAHIPFARRVVLLISVIFVLAFILKPTLIVASAQGAAAVLFTG
ncbi:MAG: NADH-quinone oxidoreductase subunit NuoN [Alphaproteobacteria bacterium]|nr:NADH-quinone oxidoreductase subunit NuoN [Alphaproteobacteria bacterium]